MATAPCSHAAQVQTKGAMVGVARMEIELEVNTSDR